jgi:hypothetical protein
MRVRYRQTTTRISLIFSSIPWRHQTLGLLFFLPGVTWKKYLCSALAQNCLSQFVHKSFFYLLSILVCLHTYDLFACNWPSHNRLIIAEGWKMKRQFARRFSSVVTCRGEGHLCFCKWRPQRHRSPAKGCRPAASSARGPHHWPSMSQSVLVPPARSSCIKLVILQNQNGNTWKFM